MIHTLCCIQYILFDIPSFQWTAERTRDNVDMAAIGASNLLLNKFVGVFDKFDNLNQVQELLRLPSLRNKSHNEAFWDNWQEDKEFAREQINGCRPRGVKRVDTKLPEGFHVTDNDIVGLLPTGKTIKSEIKRGRIFIVDNSIMGKDFKSYVLTSTLPYMSHIVCVRIFEQ